MVLPKSLFSRFSNCRISSVVAASRLPVGSSARISAGSFASALAIAAIAFFAFYKIDGKPAGLALWTLFGTINQLLAGLTLLVATLYLHQRGRNPFYTGLPMVFMLVSTFAALLRKLSDFWRKDQTLLLVVGCVLLFLAIGIIIEGVRSFLRGERHTDDAITFIDEPQLPGAGP